MLNIARREWYRIGGYKINFVQWLAWKLPKRLVYFAAIRLWAYATTDKYEATNPNELTIDESIRRWNASITPDGVGYISPKAVPGPELTGRVIVCDKCDGTGKLDEVQW